MNRQIDILRGWRLSLAGDRHHVDIFEQRVCIQIIWVQSDRFLRRFDSFTRMLVTPVTFGHFRIDQRVVRIELQSLFVLVQRFVPVSSFVEQTRHGEVVVGLRPLRRRRRSARRLSKR